MKRFHFSLQPLRTLREQKEQLAQRHYAEVLRAVEEAESRVQATLAELESCWSWLREQMSDAGFVERLDRTRAYCAVLDERRKQEQAVVEREQERLNEAWEAMLRATRDREALDRFLEKRRRAYDREVQRQDQKALDELGLRAPAATGLGASLRSQPLEVA